MIKPHTVFPDVRLTSDPKMVNDNIATVGVAFNERYKNRSGEQVDKAHFYTLEFWSKKAEYLMKYGHKGARLTAIAFPKQDRWEDQQGGKREKIVFTVMDFHFVDTAKGGDNRNASASEATDAGGFGADMGDEVPF